MKLSLLNILVFQTEYSLNIQSVRKEYSLSIQSVRQEYSLNIQSDRQKYILTNFKLIYFKQIKSTILNNDLNKI